MLRKALIAVAVIGCAISTGCESHTESKKLAQERWQKSSAGIKLSLAQQQYDEGKYEDATKTIQECIKADPELAEGRFLFGKLLLEDGRCEDAAKQLQLAVKFNGDLDEGWYCLGAATEEQKNYQQALYYYEKALALKPNNAEYILSVAEIHAVQGKLIPAIQLLEQKMMVLPKDVSLKVAAADLLCGAREYERAVKLYKESILMSGEVGSETESLGYCYIFSGKWVQAAEIFNKLLEESHDQDKKRLYLQTLALCSMNCSQYAKAVNCYSKLTIEERDDAQLWMKMGQAALGARSVNLAQMCGQKALDLQPGYSEAIVLLGCADYTSGNYRKAVRNFEKLASDDKNAGFSWLMQARCYEQLGQKDKAERAYKKAMEINPESELGDFLVKEKDTGNV